MNAEIRAQEPFRPNRLRPVNIEAGEPLIPWVNSVVINQGTPQQQLWPIHSMQSTEMNVLYTTHNPATGTSYYVKQHRDYGPVAFQTSPQAAYALVERVLAEHTDPREAARIIRESITPSEMMHGWNRVLRALNTLGHVSNEIYTQTFLETVDEELTYYDTDFIRDATNVSRRAARRESRLLQRTVQVPSPDRPYQVIEPPLAFSPHVVARVFDPEHYRDESHPLYRTFFTIMDHLEGGDASKLKDVFARDPQVAIYMVIMPLLEALADAHSKSVIDTDVKPSNVMINVGSHLQLIDFSLSIVNGQSFHRDMRELLPYNRSGTPPYVDAALLTGAIDYPDEQSDLYAVGIMLFEYLTGESALPNPENHRPYYYNVDELVTMMNNHEVPHALQFGVIGALIRDFDSAVEMNEFIASTVIDPIIIKWLQDVRQERKPSDN